MCEFEDALKADIDDHHTTQCKILQHGTDTSMPRSTDDPRHAVAAAMCHFLVDVMLTDEACGGVQRESKLLRILA